MKANDIVGERVHRGQIQNLVNWEKYDQSFDTWEPRENILDKRLLKGFHKTVDVTVDVQESCTRCARRWCRS